MVFIMAHTKKSKNLGKDFFFVHWNIFEFLKVCLGIIVYRYTYWGEPEKGMKIELKWKFEYFVFFFAFFHSVVERRRRPWNFAVEWRALKKLLNKKIWLIGLVLFFLCKVFLFRWCDLFWWWNLYGDFKYIFNTFLCILGWLNLYLLDWVI